MNRAERKVLREIIRFAIQHNKHLWWELKRNIWESGFQSYYPLQSEYDQSVRNAISSLSPSELQDLRVLYMTKFPDRPSPSDENLTTHYVTVVIEEIVWRAGLAAYRTVHW